MVEAEEVENEEAERIRKSQMGVAHKYYALFESPMGREVLKDLIDRYVIQNPYYQGDPHHTAFRCGQKDTVLDIMQLIDMYKKNSKLSNQGEEE